MKKVLAIILTGLLILPVLSGCTKVPDWAKKNDIYKETYIALAEEFKKPAEKSDNAREYIRTHDIDQERKERRGTTTSSTTRKPSTGSSIWEMDHQAVRRQAGRRPAVRHQAVQAQTDRVQAVRLRSIRPQRVRFPAEPSRRSRSSLLFSRVF